MTNPELLPADFANTPCGGWCLGDCPGCCTCRTTGCTGCPADAQNDVADAPTLPSSPGLTDEQRDQALRAMAELATVAQAIATAFVHAVLPAVQAAAQQLAAFQRQLQDVGLLDAEGKPVRAVDRPAWQSPYGPPARRH